MDEQAIMDDKLLSKDITVLDNTDIFNKEIREWHRKPTNQKKWVKFKLHLQDAHRECHKTVRK